MIAFCVVGLSEPHYELLMANFVSATQVLVCKWEVSILDEKDARVRRPMSWALSRIYKVDIRP
jgi:hypothetical protein